MLKRVGEKINRRTELCLVILLAAGLVLGVTLGMGTLTCGWHLVDDHEFLRWFYELKVEKTLQCAMSRFITRTVF